MQLGGHAAPPGPSRPSDCCAFCGYDGNGRWWLVKRDVAGVERWVCENAESCARRRGRSEQLALFVMDGGG